MRSPHFFVARAGLGDSGQERRSCVTRLWWIFGEGEAGRDRRRKCLCMCVMLAVQLLLCVLRE